ncbi:MAG: organic hydroperoxide resistance protein [Chloroflexi bacterium]|nr:MAG: organic hydroperoxide resistance protein [Chloroflexota bacterium]
MTVATPTKVLYTAEAVATGDGRGGHVRSSDGLLDIDLALPLELAGPGGHTNPEQLFAAGYAACFHSALKLVARRLEVDVTDSTVTARVGLGAGGDGGFVLTVALGVHLPNADAGQAQRAADAAHKVCPYSNATRGNIDVTVSVV